MKVYGTIAALAALFATCHADCCQKINNDCCPAGACGGDPCDPSLCCNSESETIFVNSTKKRTIRTPRGENPTDYGDPGSNYKNCRTAPVVEAAYLCTNNNGQGRECTSKCNTTSDCPTDMPDGTTAARAICVPDLGSNRCTLWCEPNSPHPNGGCPPGASCVGNCDDQWNGTQCVWGWSPPPPPRNCTAGGDCEPIGGVCCHGWHRTAACHSLHRCNH